MADLLEILNALNRRNAFFVDANIVSNGTGGLRLEEEPVGGLPRIPTVGVRFRFP